MYDHALWRAKSFLQSHDIAFVPGLNEDLAATAVWGSQQVGLFPGAKVDGVFGIWYGKGPGVDRSVDALKHANSAGTARHGGVLALAGDDHGCQSSTLAHQSEQVFAAALMPILNPATLQDYLDLGLYGFALSRFSGCWVGFKAISETVESSASIDSDPARVQVVLPSDFAMPPGGLNIRWPDPPLEQERRLHGPKMEAIAAFARANQLDRIVLDSKSARLGIVATGKAYLDLRQALATSELPSKPPKQLGLRIYKVALTWPLEESGARRFAEGLQDVLVVEEKRGFVEDQLVRILYNMDASKRPSVVGKRDEGGAMLLPSDGELTPTMVAAALVSRLRRLGHQSPELEQRLARLEAFEHPATTRSPMALQRTPYFCSGCPHNTSTKVPEGSRAMAGIGCHGMALSVPSRRTATISHMGAEGVTWIGQAPFTDEPHIFQNLGDGTYHPFRIAGAAGCGGRGRQYHLQDSLQRRGRDDRRTARRGRAHRLANRPSGMGRRRQTRGDRLGRSRQISRQRLFSGTRHRPSSPRAGWGSARTTRDQRSVSFDLRSNLRCGKAPAPQARGVSGPAQARLHQRSRVRRLRRLLANLELRFGSAARNRVRAQAEDRPIELQQGLFLRRWILSELCDRSWRHAQEGGNLLGRFRQLFADLPLPEKRELDAPFNILVTGIGGTGVITIGALLGMAAHLDGRGCSALDFTGLAQKNGAVMSHVRIARTPEEIATVRIASGGADLILGCDIVVSASTAALSRAERGVTQAIVNADLQPTASFVMNPDIDFEMNAMQGALREAISENKLDIIDATGIASALMGDSIATNAFMLGFAFQKGAIPLSLEAILRAIEINGAAIEMNKQAFSWGRLAAYDLARVRSVTQFRARATAPARSLDDAIAHRAAFLVGYQDKAYADRYLATVSAARKAEAGAAPGSSDLAEAVAKNMFKLMAYKDEYEVARLYTDGSFADKLKTQFDGDFRMKFQLAPPLFARRDKVTGRPRKSEFGGWTIHLFRVLARLKFLRGTALDPFGYTRERKAERQLIADYEAMLRQRMPALQSRDLPTLIKLARIPETIRGYGYVKDESIRKAAQQRAHLLADLDNNRFAVAAE